MPSRRKDIRMSQTEMTAFLHSQANGAMATMGPGEFPHVVHLAYLYREEDGSVWAPSFAKAQKVVNLRRNPHAAFLVESIGDYADIKGALLRGVVSIIDDPDQVKAFHYELQGHAQRFHRSENVPPIDIEAIAPKRVALRLEVKKTVSWDHSRLGGLY